MNAVAKERYAFLLRTLLLLSIPTIAEEVLTTLLQYVDTAMVGRLGEQATAAVSVTTTINWLLGSIFSAIGTAVLTLISQAIGAGKQERAARLSQQALFLCGVCGMICGGIAITLSPYIPVWMGADEAVQRQASVYFLIISVPVVFRAATTILGAAIRATQDTKTPMLISIGANLLNMGLNYVLIYACGLGVTGAAIASAISYTVSGVLMFAAYRHTPLLRWEWKTFSPDVPLLKQCWKIGGPVLGTSVTSCFGYIVFAGMVSGMGTTIFAAHSIAVTAETIFYIPGYGLRTATSALVGTAVGEQNAQKLHDLSRISVALTMVMMCLNGLILYLVARPLMMIFTPVNQVIELGAEMLRLVAFSEPFFGLMIVLEGIFYGLGRTRYAFIVETASMWGIRIFLTFLCVHTWGLGLRAVWYCMIADNVFKALLFAIPFAAKRMENIYTDTQ